MKLIDILVQELPDLGGWPIGADGLYQNAKGHLIGVQGCIISPVDMELGIVAEDLHRSVTREQYESALAASKPEWDGEGLPPVGCNVEALFEGEWVEVTVAYCDCPKPQWDASVWNEALVFNRITTKPFWTDEFRPIRSEADKKRENGILSLAKAAGAMPFRYGETLGDGKLLGSSWYELYDKIAAGEVAGIRID